MITFDNERQAEAAVRLWQEAFGDEEAYIRLFLRRHDDAAALTESVDGSLVSALYLIDGELIVDSVPHKAFYLFAAATFQQHRGHGQCGDYLWKSPAGELCVRAERDGGEQRHHHGEGSDLPAL